MLRTKVVKQGGVLKVITGVEGRGRVLSVRAIKPCSFRGKHNRTRAVALLVLAQSELARRQGGVLSASQIAELGGLPYNSVLSNMGRWRSWHLVERYKTSPVRGLRGVYAYKILSKGLDWLSRHELHMMEQLLAWDELLAVRRGYGLFEALRSGTAENSRVPRAKWGVY